MEVQGPGSVQRPISVQRRLPSGSAKAANPAAGVPATPKDAVEISSAGQLLDKLSKSPEIRAERLAQIKADIASGHYDTDEKLEAALMNLFQSMVGMMPATTEAIGKSLPKSDLPAVEVSASPRDKFEEFLATRGPASDAGTRGHRRRSLFQPSPFRRR